MFLPFYKLFFREIEEDNKEFRELITEYIEENIERCINFIPEEDIDIPENKEWPKIYIHKKFE